MKTKLIAVFSVLMMTGVSHSYAQVVFDFLNAPNGNKTLTYTNLDTAATEASGFTSQSGSFSAAGLLVGDSFTVNMSAYTAFDTSHYVTNDAIGGTSTVATLRTGSAADRWGVIDSASPTFDGGEAMVFDFDLSSLGSGVQLKFENFFFELTAAGETLELYHLTGGDATQITLADNEASSYPVTPSLDINIADGDQLIIFQPTSSTGTYWVDGIHLDVVTAVPEPSTYTLIVLGAGSLFLLRRFRKTNSKK